MTEISVQELRTRTAEVVQSVRARAARYIITYRGKPVAQLVPLEEARFFRPGPFRAGEASLDQQEHVAHALAEIQAIRHKLSGWLADLTQSVVASHQEG